MANTKSRTYDYPRPAVAVDGVVLGLGDDSQLHVLLIQRGLAPFENQWALPGGFVRENEGLDHAIERELREETGLQNVYLEQLFTFGAPDRDPRKRVISIAYLALVRPDDHVLDAQTDAKVAAWFSVNDIPALAFDHDEIFAKATTRLRAKIRYTPLAFELLPKKFSLSRVQKLYEQILTTAFDKRNFRKRLLAMDILDELDEYETGVSHRAARLYKFNDKKAERLPDFQL